MMNKSYNRKYETSPLFSFTNVELATNESQFIDLELDNTSIAKYLPLNNINIQNSSSEKVELTVNQDDQKKYILQPGTIISMDETIFPAIRYIKIKNLSASTISASEVNITVYKVGVTVEGIVERTHQKLFKKKKWNVI